MAGKQHGKREGEGAAIGVMVGTDLLPCGGGTAEVLGMGLWNMPLDTHGSTTYYPGYLG